jgi:hypothetical protein
MQADAEQRAAPFPLRAEAGREGLAGLGASADAGGGDDPGDGSGRMADTGPGGQAGETRQGEGAGAELADARVAGAVAARGGQAAPPAAEPQTDLGRAPRYVALPAAQYALEGALSEVRLGAGRWQEHCWQSTQHTLPRPCPSSSLVHPYQDQRPAPS